MKKTIETSFLQEFNLIPSLFSQSQSHQTTETVDTSHFPRNKTDTLLAIMELPTQIYNDDRTCSICLDDIKLKVLTNCGHVFCGKCLFKYIDARTLGAWVWGIDHGTTWPRLELKTVVEWNTPKCPHCYQRMTRLFPHFHQEEISDVKSGKEVLDKVKQYNHQYVLFNWSFYGLAYVRLFFRKFFHELDWTTTGKLGRWQWWRRESVHLFPPQCFWGIPGLDDSWHNKMLWYNK